MDEKDLLKIAHRIERGDKKSVTVLGRTFRIGDTKRNILNKINDIQLRVKFFSEDESLKGMRKRLRFLNTADARIASLLLLNGWANIPLLHAIHWRIINRLYTTETLSAILATGLNDNETAFFLKNCVLVENTLMTRLMMIKTS